ncbi:MAG TPA: hypothetical protein VMM12_08450 [Longimicrobiales bacterium]|nr:hypothetical protein [Longimicrobiales bacterium]
MDSINWAFYALITAAALAAVVLHYRVREPAGRGRGVLASLRAASLALLILLLFDPVLPAPAGASGGGDTVVLLDASLSMTLPEPGGGTRWDAATGSAGAAGAARVLRFGGAEVVAGIGDAPDATGTRLEPAMRAAAESGARRVVVVSDAGVEDAAEALGVARRAGLAVELRLVGEDPPPNAGIVEVEAPAWAEVGEETAVRVSVAAIGAVPDSLGLVLRQGGRELARARVEGPAAGRLSTATLRFTPRAPTAGPVRLDAALEETDAAAGDDVRSVYLRIEEAPAGVALVSFRPDQEPRFLMPVLERALGVPVRGWMALPGGRYVQLGVGPDAGGSAGEAAVRRAVREADLVVLHALAPSSPGWAREAAASARRALIFPTAPGAEGLPFAPGPERPGDWYPTADIPPSPVAALLAGLEPADAPPLTALRTPDAPAGWWGPLVARLGRRGEARPVLLAGTTGGRRVAVALGDGYWRWRFSGGAGRETYDRLWSAVGGWLMAGPGAVAGAGAGPADRVVARGEPVVFRAPPGADSLALRIFPAGAAEPAVDSTLRVRGGEAVAGVLPPGHYRYEAVVFDGGGGERTAASGELTVESFSREFTRTAVSLDPEAGEARGARGSAAGRPLRASAWPWALLMVLLCVEWVLRRRWGLR